MAWPRIGTSRSSAQPGTPAEVTVRPAAEADQAPEGERNAGIRGATHGVVEDSGGGSGLPPIRYAHSGVDEGLAAEPAPAPAFHPAGRDPAAGPVNEGLAILGAAGPGEDEEPDERATVDLPALGTPRGDGTAAVDETGPLQDPGAPPPDGPVPPGTGQPAQELAGVGWNQQIVPPQAAAVAAETDQRQPRPGGRGEPAAGGGQQRVTVRDLPPDVQLRFWRRRVLLMVVVGAVVAIFTRNWVLALTLAIIVGIIDTVQRSRNAAQYQNGARLPGAQKKTRKQLTRMRRAGYFALEARPIPNSREYIDHLVVGPTGVYAIDSERWDPKLPIRTLNGTRLYHGPASQKERLEHAAWEAAQASAILTEALGTEITVRPALAIYGPRIPWDIATIREVDVFTGGALGKYLKRRSRMRGEVPRLTREEVRTIYDTATRMLPDVAPTMTAAPVG